MRINVTIDGDHPAVLTTEHAGSSYDLPVLVIDGVAHGPADVIARGMKRLWPAEVMTGETAAAIKSWMSQAPMTEYCYRCGWLWYLRAPNGPGQCPHCGSAQWRTPRQGNEPGQKPRR